MASDISATSSLVGSLVETATVISSLAACATAAIIAYQVWCANRQSRRQFTFQILQNYRDPDFKVHERFVKNNLTPDLAEEAFSNSIMEVEISNGKNNSPKKIVVKDAIIEVSYFYDLVGMLVFVDAVDVDLLLADLGDDAVICWERIKPYIDAVRKKRLDERSSVTKFSVLQYQIHFDYLQQKAKYYNLPRKYRSVHSSPRSIPRVKAPYNIQSEATPNND